MADQYTYKPIKWFPNDLITAEKLNDLSNGIQELIDKKVDRVGDTMTGPLVVNDNGANAMEINAGEKKIDAPDYEVNARYFTGTAEYANKDNLSQPITSTYIKNLAISSTNNGVVITKGNNSNSTITFKTGDDTTLGVGKLYSVEGQNTDGAMTQKATTDKVNKEVETLNTRIDTEVDTINSRIDNEVSDLNDTIQTTKEELKQEINDLASISLSREVVPALPAISEMKDNVIYMVPIGEGDKDGNTYEEYLLINGKAELIGTTKTDLTGFVREETLEEEIEKVNKKISDTAGVILEELAEDVKELKDSIESSSGDLQSVIDSVGQELKEEIDTKQDKLVGTAGQVVGFDEDGNAIAQDANFEGGIGENLITTYALRNLYPRNNAKYDKVLGARNGYGIILDWHEHVSGATINSDTRLNYTVEEGALYTCSFMAYANQEGIIIDNRVIGNSNENAGLTLTTTPTLYSVTSTITDLSAVFYMIGGMPEGSQVIIYDIKLEKGSKATAWCPSYLDYVSEFKLQDTDGINLLNSSTELNFNEDDIANQENNVTVEEWGATDAIRIISSDSSSYVRSRIDIPKEYVKKDCVFSLYIKNNTGKDLYASLISPNGEIALPKSNYLSPYEAKRMVFYVSSERDTTSYGAVVSFFAQLRIINPEYKDTPTDITYWHPKYEVGQYATGWTRTLEEMGTGSSGGGDAKLYSTTGSATDGAMTQKATTDALNKKQDKVVGGENQLVGFDADGNMVAVEPEVLEVGGRNLLINSKDYVISAVGTSGSFPSDLGYELGNSLLAKTYYTLSGCFTSGYNSSTMPEVIAINIRLASGEIFSSKSVVWHSKPNIGYFKITFIADKEYKDLSEIKIGATTVNDEDYYVTFDNLMKLERGNIATDWTPAPEDKQDKITYGTTDLIPGASLLSTGTFYFVYEE